MTLHDLYKQLGIIQFNMDNLERNKADITMRINMEIAKSEQLKE